LTYPRAMFALTPALRHFVLRFLEVPCRASAGGLTAAVAPPPPAQPLPGPARLHAGPGHGWEGRPKWVHHPTAASAQPLSGSKPPCVGDTATLRGARTSTTAHIASGRTQGVRTSRPQASGRTHPQRRRSALNQVRLPTTGTGSCWRSIRRGRADEPMPTPYVGDSATLRGAGPPFLACSSGPDDGIQPQTSGPEPLSSMLAGGDTTAGADWPAPAGGAGDEVNAGGRSRSGTTTICWADGPALGAAPSSQKRILACEAQRENPWPGQRRCVP